MKKDILNELSQAIFKKPYHPTKQREMEFVRYQEKAYRRYQDEIRALHQKLLAFRDELGRAAKERFKI